MYLSTAQACGRLGISRYTLAKLIRGGKIDAIKGEAKNSHLKVCEVSVEAYRAQRKVVPSDGPTLAGLTERERYRRYSFRERFVYVVAFASGAIKVGCTDYPERRFKELARSSFVGFHNDSIVRTWTSPLHLDAFDNEKKLIGFCNRRGQRFSTSEFFAGISFESAVAFAKTLTYRQTSDEDLDAFLEDGRRRLDEITASLGKGPVPADDSGESQ